MRNRLDVVVLPLILAVGLARPASGQIARAEMVPDNLGVVQLVGLAFVFGDEARVFVIGQRGRIAVIKNGVVLPEPFLDITASTWVSSEAGLLGMVFHPNYTTNGRFCR